jgi:methylmalonyl-CoA mutase cobalamin-binding subunit
MNRPLLMSIAAVERDTGLSKDTLRVWEKRYGFPAPERDAQGERCYPMDQIERLRVIKRLLDVGHRPGRVVTLPMVDLGALASRSADAQGLMGATPRRNGSTVPAPAPATASVWQAPLPSDTHLYTSPEQAAWRGHPWLPQAMACIEQHDPLAMRHVLARALATLGLPEFIASVACPLLQALGEGWLRGRIQIAQEHWVSHLLQQTLHSAIHDLPLSPVAHAPRVLLSTFPGEPHGLGLLMVEAWLTLLQAQVINLGPQTPLWDLVQTATLYKVDVLALSFTANAPAALVQDTLAECRAKLPAHIALWAGGQHPLLQRKPPEGVLVLTDMASVQQALAPWRPGSST